MPDTQGYFWKYFTLSNKEGNSTFSVAWELVSQDIATNTSKIRIYARQSIDYPYSESMSTYAKIIVNGVTYTAYTNTRLSWSAGGDVSTYPIDKVIDIPHNLDGSKTFTFEGYGGRYSYDEFIGSGSYTLAQIPQATTIKSFPDFTIGTNFTISLESKSTSYTNKLELKVGNTIIKTIADVTDSATVNLSTAEQDILYSTIPNSTTATVTLVCTTLSGSIQVGLPSTANAIATVPSSIVPTFTSITSSELNANVTNIVGAKYVKTLSNIRLTINGASGAKSSTITKYKINYDGADYNTNTVDTGVINWSGTKTVTATIVDSRGRTASKTLDITVLDYFTPAISSALVQRCDSSGNVSAMGTYIKLPIIYTVSSLLNSTEKNNSTLTIKTKLKTESTWTQKFTQTYTALSNNSVWGNYSTYDTTKSYDVLIELKDKFNTSTSYLSLSTGQVVMSWGQTGVGIGKIWENHALDINGNIDISSQQGSGIYLKDETTGTKWHLHTHGDRLRLHNGSSEITFTALGDTVSNSETVDGIHASQINYGADGFGTTNVSSFNNLQKSGFYDGSGAVGSPSATWHHLINNNHNNSQTGNIYTMQLSAPFWNQDLFFRVNNPDSPNSAWNKVWHSGNLPITFQTTVPTSLSSGAICYVYE